MLHRPIVFLIRKPRLFRLLSILTLIILGSLFTYTSVTSNALKGKVIVVDPGHGGQDPGAQYAGIKEKDLNLDIALRLRNVLSSKGCKVVLTREVDKDFFAPNFVRGRMAKRVELNERVELAAQNNADLFISIHANSFPQKNSYGMETYYHFKSAAGKALSERIQKHLKTVQPDNKRKAKSGDYYLLNQTKMPAVLVEVGFLSNPRERTLLTTDSYKNKIAEAISNGIEDYFKDFPLGVEESSPALAHQEGPVKSGDHSFKLYYPSENLETLTAEERTLGPSWAALNHAEKISYILNELLKGPRGKNSIFPIASAQVLGVNIQNGIATLNFTKDLREGFTGGAQEEEMAIKSIVWSTAQVGDIRGVRILINGEAGDSIGGHISLNQTFTPQPQNGKVAIVIDDFGINNPGVKDMLDLGIPITGAVMPNLMFTKAEAELLHQKGYEIILHMPMEAKNASPEWIGPGALLTHLSPEEIRARLIKGLDSVQYAIGINNHMGSKATESPKVVKEIVALAKERQLVILDSKTSDTSLLYKEAFKSGVPCGLRDVFLDNSSDVNSIKKQIRTLIETAKKNGKAIGIGHVGPQGPNTARAIREMLPEFEKQGIQPVYLSELLE